MMRHFLLAASLLAVPAGAAEAPPKVKTIAMTCPVGGAAFDYAAPVAAPTTGERPDGKPYGADYPIPLPECPDNGLVLYKDYSPDEAKKLEPLVASEAYQALRKDDTQYYRAYWLMKAMGVGPEDYLWALLQASWQAEGKPELRNRYLAELAEGSAKAPARPGDLNWIGMEGRAINALRELGRFDEALARLDKVPVKSLDVAIPVAGDESAAAKQARVRRAWLRYFTEMKPVLERKDASLEPFELLPRGLAFSRCIDAAAGLTDSQRAYCESQKAAIDAWRAARDKQAREMEALRRSREESGR